MKTQFQGHQARFGDLFEQTSDLVCTMTSEGRFLQVNGAWCKALGHSRVDMDTRTLRDILHPDFHGDLDALFGRVVQSGEVGQWETAFVTKDGRQLLIEGRLYAAREGVAPLVVLGLFRDVTGRKRAVEALHRLNIDLEQRVLERTAELEAANEKLRLSEFSVEHSSVATFWVASDARIFRANQAACQLTGRSQEELRELTMRDLDCTMTETAWASHWHELCQRKHLVFETRFRCRLGKEIPVELEVNWLEFDRREFNFTFIRDITERKRSEARLRESEALYQSLVEHVPQHIFRKDAAGRFTFGNGAFCRGMGKSQAEILGKTDLDFFPAEVAAKYRADDERVLQTGVPFEGEETFQQMDGQKVFVSVLKEPLRNDAGQIVGLQGIAWDITERRRAEEQLRKLSRAVEQSPASIVITNPQGVIEYVNPKFCAITGYSPEEVCGQNPRVLKSGEMPVEVYRQLWETIRAGREWRGELHNKRKNGELFWEQASISPIMDEAGRVTHFLAVKEDISGRKAAEAERARIEMQLLQAQKLESVGRLAAGIAHEINSPTQFIGDNTRFVRDGFKDLQGILAKAEQLLAAAKNGSLTPELLAELEAAIQAADLEYLMAEVPKALEQSLEGVARVTKLVRAMKDFSHPGTEAKSPADLNAAIESTVTVCRNEWKYVAEVVLDFDPNLPPVPCLLGEFNQVILNLVINAAHAIADVVGDGTKNKGAITVRTRRDEDWVEVEVEDTGPGIPETLRARMFEPFFTTKPVGKGTGQGLAIARSVIVDKHRGTIHFESVVGKGTTFLIRLPLKTGLA